MPNQTFLPGQECQVFLADDIYVSHGVALGDGLGLPDEVCPGDVYWLDPDAVPRRLVIDRAAGGQRIAAGSEIGAEGQTLALVARYRLLVPQGDPLDILLVQLGAGELCALPLAPVAPRVDYTLVAVDEAPEGATLADLLCVAFVRGTRITMGDGSQRPIEGLAPGDTVLTRDHGRQPLRMLGRATLRAIGGFAPVVIGKGVMGNSADLMVSQQHRLFLYLPRAEVGLPTSEVLVQARHLVDGDTVWLREGGFVDYFSLVFDRHEIVYAEGIPVESLLVSEATVTRLPPELADAVRDRVPGLAHAQHYGTEADAEALARMKGALRARRDPLRRG